MNAYDGLGRALPQAVPSKAIIRRSDALADNTAFQRSRCRYRK